MMLHANPDLVKKRHIALFEGIADTQQKSTGPNGGLVFASRREGCACVAREWEGLVLPLLESRQGGKEAARTAWELISKHVIEGDSDAAMASLVESFGGDKDLVAALNLPPIPHPSASAGTGLAIPDPGAGPLTPLEAAASVLIPLSDLANRIKKVPPFAQSLPVSPPAHCVSADQLTKLCEMLEMFKDQGAAGGNDGHGVDEVRHNRAKGQVVSACLSLIRANLEWMVLDHAPKLKGENATSAAAVAASPAPAPAAGDMKRVEALVRSIAIEGVHGCEGAQEEAQKAHIAGASLFFKEGGSLVESVWQVLCDVRDRRGGDGARQVCAGMLWRLGTPQEMWASLKEVEKDKMGAECLLKVMGEMSEIMFKEVSEAVLSNGDEAFADRSSVKIESTSASVPWVWGQRHTRSTRVSNGGKTVRKNSSRPDYSTIFMSCGAIGYGVYEWEVTMDTCERASIGVCSPTQSIVDAIKRSHGGAWCWYSHGTMCGPQVEIGESNVAQSWEAGGYESGDVITMRLHMAEETLTFFKNGENKGTLNRVVGQVVPFVCFDNEGEQATITKASEECEWENGQDTKHLSLTCSRALRCTMLLLLGMTDKTPISPSLQVWSATVINHEF